MRNMNEDDVRALMQSDAYQNSYNPEHKDTVKRVSQAWQNLYPNDARNLEPSNYYVWHSTADSKTRSAHAERNGKVFCWDNPPEGGHPGEDYNCRCWAEEYVPPKDKQDNLKLIDNLEYASAGAMQGLSLGFADEMEGLMGSIGYSLGSLNPQWNKNGESVGQAAQRGYIENRDKRRDHIKEGYDKSPAIMTISESIGAIANPIKFTKTSRTAPLTIKSKINLIDAAISGGVYGLGVSEGDYQDYAKNISSSIIGNVAGYGLSNRRFGRAGSPLGRKMVNEFTNWSAKKLIKFDEDDE